MRARLTATVCMGLTLFAATAVAHHSFVAEFDVNQPITLTGALTKMQWNNPHGWIYIDVKDESGTVVNWAVEFSSPNTMIRRGLRRTDFPIGSEVIVKGYRAKNGKPIVNGDPVTFKDGRNFYLGASETPGTPPK